MQEPRSPFQRAPAKMRWGIQGDNQAAAVGGGNCRVSSAAHAAPPALPNTGRALGPRGAAPEPLGCDDERADDDAHQHGEQEELQRLCSAVVQRADAGPGPGLGGPSPTWHGQGQGLAPPRPSAAATSLHLLAAAVPSAYGAPLRRRQPTHDPHIDSRKPIFHVMPKTGWGSDPNGPIFWRGRYHL